MRAVCVLLAALVCSGCGKPAARSFLVHKDESVELDLGKDRCGCQRFRSICKSEEGLTVTGEFSVSGTMHYADNLILSLPGAVPLVLYSDVAGGHLEPEGLAHVLRLPWGDYLVLGRSCWDGNWHVQHVMLVGRRRSAVKLIDEIIYDMEPWGGASDQYEETGMFVCSGTTGPRVGLIEPPEKGCDELNLTVAGVYLHGNEVRLLRYDAPPAELRDVIGADTHEGERFEIPKRRIAWFGIGAKGFVGPGGDVGY